jgi:hypothetical protein
MTAAFQLAGNTPVAVARKLFMNTFDLFTQLLVVGVTPAAMLCIGFVVIAAGRKSSYLAGFRN